MTRKAQSAMEFLMTYGWAILVLIIVVAVLFYIGVMNPKNTTPDACTFPPGFTCSSFKITGHNDGIGGYLDLSIGQAVGRTIQILNIACTQEEGEPYLLYTDAYAYADPMDLSRAPAEMERRLSFSGGGGIIINPPEDPNQAWFTNVTVPSGEMRPVVGIGSDNPDFLCVDSNGEYNEEFNTGDATKYGQLYKGKIWIYYNETDTGTTRVISGEITGRFEPPYVAAATATPECAIDDDCDDGNACIDDWCDTSVCFHEPTDCNDGNPCTTDDCNVVTGCFTNILPDGEQPGCNVTQACVGGICT